MAIADRRDRAQHLLDLFVGADKPHRWNATNGRRRSASRHRLGFGVTPVTDSDA